MIFASKTTFSCYNLKILRPKVTKNLTNLRKKFCEFPPWFPVRALNLYLISLDQYYNQTILKHVYISSKYGLV